MAGTDFSVVIHDLENCYWNLPNDQDVADVKSLANKFVVPHFGTLPEGGLLRDRYQELSDQAVAAVNAYLDIVVKLGTAVNDIAKEYRKAESDLDDDAALAFVRQELASINGLLDQQGVG